jgi:hypothetical protein
MLSGILNPRVIDCVSDTTSLECKNDFGEFVMRAYQEGLATDTLFKSKIDPTNEQAWTEKREQVRKQLNAKYNVQHHGIQKAVIAAFWLGVLENRSNGIRVTSMNATIGTIFQHDAILALLWLPGQAFRATFLGTLQEICYNKTEWNWTIAGAIGHARVVYALLLQTEYVYLPTIQEDMFQKVDLYAYFKKTKIGFCLQIKSRKGPFCAIEHKILNRNQQLEIDETKLIIQAELTQEKQPNLIWIPAMINLGGDRYERDDLENCIQIQDGIRDLVDIAKAIKSNLS